MKSFPTSGRFPSSKFFNQTISNRGTPLPGLGWWIGLFSMIACSLPAQTFLVHHGDSWRYRKGTAANAAPQTNWKTVADPSLDVTWLTGNGGFGYADNTTETAL